jgi:hypothetical protein
MYRGSGKYFVSMLVARFGFLYGAGGTVNTAFQLIVINIGLMSRQPQSIESVPYYVEAWVNVVIPILPPYTLGDVVNVVFNLLIAMLIAFIWTIRWSEGMNRHNSW